MLRGGGRGWWVIATLPLTQAAEVDCTEKLHSDINEKALKCKPSVKCPYAIPLIDGPGY